MMDFNGNGYDGIDQFVHQCGDVLVCLYTQTDGFYTQMMILHWRWKIGSRHDGLLYRFTFLWCTLKDVGWKERIHMHIGCLLWLKRADIHAYRWAQSSRAWHGVRAVCEALFSQSPSKCTCFWWKSGTKRRPNKKGYRGARILVILHLKWWIMY